MPYFAGKIIWTAPAPQLGRGGPRETAWSDRLMGRPPGRFVWVAEAVVLESVKILLLAIKMANNFIGY